MSEEDATSRKNAGRRVQIVIGGALVLLLAAGAAMVRRASEKTNKVALDQSAKLVSFVTAEAATYQPSRSYIGTLQPRAEANVGPQLIAAYVDTVLFRPGAVVKRGQVMATLDCRNASTESRATAMKVREITAHEQALEDQSARYQSLLDGGFVAANEAEQMLARSQEQQAQLLSEQAQLANTSLQVDDCVLRAPFDGEVGSRTLDPGAFVHPGTPILSVIDRGKVIVMVDAPEKDFELVAPGTKVTLQVIATGQELHSTIARRAPKADASTRTIHFEIDLPDPARELPVGTTGHIHIDVGKPVAAVRIPLYAAAVKDDKVSVFVVDGEVAHQRNVPLDGESAGQLYVGVDLASGSKVVAQGRELLSDGDRVSASPEVQEAVKRSTP
jgi:membrane fusion protein (multidrug efflux system)